MNSLHDTRMFLYDAVKLSILQTHLQGNGGTYLGTYWYSPTPKMDLANKKEFKKMVLHGVKPWYRSKNGPARDRTVNLRICVYQVIPRGIISTTLWPIELQDPNVLLFVVKLQIKFIDIQKCKSFVGHQALVSDAWTWAWGNVASDECKLPSAFLPT